ncbi:MAG: GNAT family N-acetyltransferase [Lachnospiraceae bacterium]|nr:GNAT family N-acetyltransferase [Lachnospiraceae bacterium]
MEIKTERLLIRKVVANDWESIKRIWDDFRVSEYAKYDVPHKSDADEIKLQVNKWENTNQGDQHLFFAVCFENEVIGYIDFHDTGNGYESGYCFHSNYHGKGYAKESYQALINLFSARGIKRLTAGTALKNIPSVRLLNSLGFTQIGTEKVSFYQDEEGNDIYFDGGIFELKME